MNAVGGMQIVTVCMSSELIRVERLAFFGFAFRFLSIEKSRRTFLAYDKYDQKQTGT